MTCIACQHWSLRDSGLARHWAGRCACDPPETLRSFNADQCERFVAVDEHDVERRRRWMQGNRIRVKEASKEGA